MIDLTRRGVLGATGSVLGAGLMSGVAVAQGQPATAAAGGAKVELPPLHAASELNASLPNPEPVARRLGVAVVGIGHLTLEQILPAFGQSKRTRLTALVSGDAAKARVVAAQYGVPDQNLYDYTSFDAVRNNPAIDIVYVVVPNAMHLEYVTRAAAAGKHVLCEKPMATSSKEAEAMIAACRAARVRLMIAYRMQYEPTQRAAIAMVRDGTVGDLRLIEAVNGQNDTPGQWRQVKAMAGGGSLPDVGIYCYNAFRYLTGEEPVEITARVTRPGDDPRFREVEDLAQFTLQFPSGVMGVGTSGYSIHERRSMAVVGSTGWIGFDNAFAYNNNAMSLNRKAGTVYGTDRRQFAPKNQFAAEMDHFAEAIQADRIPHTPGEEGLADMRIMEAIYQAAEGGGTVKLPAVAGRDTTRGPAPAPEG